MTNAHVTFCANMAEAHKCLENFDATGHEFALRHIWVVCISALELYMTELISEAGLRWIDRTPPVLTPNLRQVQVPLGEVLHAQSMSPAEKLLFYRNSVYTAVQYTSFYRPDKVSEALSYIWTCPAKEKWSRVANRMKESGRYAGKTEQHFREQLTLIGDRRDLIAHSVDTTPGATAMNPVSREDSVEVIQFIEDIATGIDLETENQLAAANV